MHFTSIKKAFYFTHGRFSRIWLLFLVMPYLSSCTTTHTAGLIKSGPMDFDLEKRVMWETKLSGTAVGVVGGMVAGALVGGLISAATGGMGGTQQAGLIGGTAAAGAVAGGFFGYQKGKEKGQKIVATAKEKEQFQRLVQGAKEYNSKVAGYNANLRQQLADAKKAKDKKKLTALRKDAGSKLQSVSARIHDRSALVEKIVPESRAPYSKTVPELEREQNKLKKTLQDIGAAEAPISL
ncbi:hypothetical protein [Prosthecobacter sp.]|uniref:hypothetical protein n=1 Tax=Prosthecobacter sp. TaxID=1965333 RepID=UPI0037851501